jgi:hypothetical protein
LVARSTATAYASQLRLVYVRPKDVVVALVPKLPAREREQGEGPARTAPKTLGHVPTTVDEALRLAVKLAVDGGNYECAAEVLNILKRA